MKPSDPWQVSARLEKLQADCLGRINAALPGQPSGDKDLTWTRCEFSTGHGQALYSPVLFTYARQGKRDRYRMIWIVQTGFKETKENSEVNIA